MCCKVQEHIIMHNILRHLDDDSILNNCQHGFPARCSCETQLLTLALELAESIDKRRQVVLIILDFSKAFECVPHQCLLTKTDHYSIRGQTDRWIQSVLSERSIVYQDIQSLKDCLQLHYSNYSKEQTTCSNFP